MQASEPLVSKDVVDSARKVVRTDRKERAATRLDEDESVCGARG